MLHYVAQNRGNLLQIAPLPAKLGTSWMMRVLLKAVFVSALCVGLGACVPDPSLGTPPLATPPAGKTDDAAYVARKDGAFSIPAIPLEKLPEQYRRQSVAFQTDEAPGTIIINPAARYLHFVTGKNKAIRYGISVGRAGFEWSGVANVTERKQWPTWTPPEEMIARKPELAKWEKGQPGGPTNPLGARALYLTTNGVDYGYRIHGTPEWQSIGSSASSGCIRMINQDVIDLFARVPAGAKVIVLNADGSMPTGLKLPPPAPKVKKAKAAVVKAVEPVMPALPVPPPLDSELVAPAAAVVPAPVAAVAPATTAPAAVAPACTVPLVNGACPTPAVKP
jgi:lipoprotein-anchoring transpeptidase ErfK/SrfK